ncbi:MAG: WG repeat-containing protein [Opitutaceae bacterium]|nr:WG repeat-containing protein [Cytophagales bacterium]
MFHNSCFVFYTFSRPLPKILACVWIFILLISASQSSFSQKRKVIPLKNDLPVLSDESSNSKKWILTDTSFKVLMTINADSFQVQGSNILRFVNHKQQIIFPVLSEYFYDEIKILNKSYYKVQLKGRWGLFKNDGKMVLPIQYSSIQYLPPYFQVWDGEKTGLLDSNLKEVLSIKYSRLSINLKTKRVSLNLPNAVGIFKLDDSCKYWLPDIDSLTAINDSILLSWTNSKCSITNLEFQNLSLKSFLNASQVSDTSLVAFDSDSLYFYHLNKKLWSSRKEKVWMLLHDTLGLIKDTTMGVHHFRSDTIIHFEGDSAWKHPQLPGKLLVKKGAYYGLANFEGRLLANFNRCFTHLGEPVNGYMEVISKRKYGFIDTNGYMYFATLYDSVKPAKNGYCAIKLRGKWGYASRKESVLVQPNYTKTSEFLGVSGPAWTGIICMLVDNKGNELFKPRFDDLVPTSKYWLSQKRGLFGFLQTDGKELLNPRFSKVTETSTGYFIVTQYDKTGILNDKLEPVYSFENRKIQFLKNSPYLAIEVK